MAKCLAVAGTSTTDMSCDEPAPIHTNANKGKFTIKLLLFKKKTPQKIAGKYPPLDTDNIL